MKKEDIDEVWFKIRSTLKNKDFLTKLQKFDIRRVQQKHIQTIDALFANDPWMTTAWIAKESQFALGLFKWVHTIIDYIGVAKM